VKPITILLVEDEEADISVMKRSFKGLKVANKLLVARNGLEALSILKKEGEYKEEDRPNIILLDLNMPVMDGKEFLKIVKNDESFKDIPIAVMTSSDTEEDVIKSYELGCNCYVRKPIDYMELKKVVEAIDQFWFSIVSLPDRG
jgi:CheY-like chemotaxis protein